MRGSTARRELAFVLALAITGLALVVAVAFTPWYPVLDGAAALAGSAPPGGG
jgi:hypothetical protein